MQPQVVSHGLNINQVVEFYFFHPAFGLYKKVILLITAPSQFKVLFCLGACFRKAFKRNRFHEVIQDIEFESFYGEVWIGRCNDREEGRFTYGLKKLYPSHAGHLNIEKDQV